MSRRTRLVATAATVMAALALTSNAHAGNHGGRSGGGNGGGGSGGFHGGGSIQGRVSGNIFRRGGDSNQRVTDNHNGNSSKSPFGDTVPKPTVPPVVGGSGGKSPKGPLGADKKFPGGDVGTKIPTKDPGNKGPFPPKNPMPPKNDPPHNDHHPNHDDHAGDHDHHHHDHCPPIRIWLPPYYPSSPEVVVVEKEVIVADATTPVVPAAPVAPVTQAAATLPADAVAAAKAAVKNAAATVPADVSKELEAAQVAGKLPVVPAGATLALEGKDLGVKQGRIVLQIGQISLPATVESWDGKQATVTLPNLGLTQATTAQVHVYTADSKLANSVAIQLVPAVEEQANDAVKPVSDKTPMEQPSKDKAASSEPVAGQSQVAGN